MIPRTKHESPQKLLEEISNCMVVNAISNQNEQSQQTNCKSTTFSQVHNNKQINSKKIVSPEKKPATQFSPPPQIYKVYDCQESTTPELPLAKCISQPVEIPHRTVIRADSSMNEE
ncbi:MAG: hypothetical protein ACMG6E_02495 [Candidatus Roizmanbacteria bacterium]